MGPALLRYLAGGLWLLFQIRLAAQGDADPHRVDAPLARFSEHQRKDSFLYYAREKIRLSRQSDSLALWAWTYLDIHDFLSGQGETDLQSIDAALQQRWREPAGPARRARDRGGVGGREHVATRVAVFPILLGQQSRCNAVPAPIYRSILVRVAAKPGGHFLANGLENNNWSSTLGRRRIHPLRAKSNYLPFPTVICKAIANLRGDFPSGADQFCFAHLLMTP